MSACNPCLNTLPISRCLTNLIIGTITPNTAVKVYIYNITIEKTIVYPVTSDNTGLITIPITPQRFSDDFTYELYITLATATSIEDKLPFVIDSYTTQCANIRFKTVYNSDNEIETYTDQRLKAAV